MWRCSASADYHSICHVYSWSKLKSCGRRPPKTAVATDLRPFSAESSWTAGASKSARQLSATAPCINPRHFELGIPTLHVPTIYFKAKQNQACHYDVPPQTLARWKSRRVVIILPTIPLLWVRLPSPCRRHRPKRNKSNQPLLPIQNKEGIPRLLGRTCMASTCLLPLEGHMCRTPEGSSVSPSTAFILSGQRAQIFSLRAEREI